MISIPLRWGIVTSFATIVAVSSYFNFKWVVNELRPTYLTVVEDSLNDTARLLAALVSSEGAEPPVMDVGTGFSEMFQRMEQISFSARIYELTKAKVDLFVYVTDDQGQVVFHSLEKEAVGEDFSNWRDVRLTLEGDYGARTTRGDPEDATTAVLYVAAPILVGSQIRGVVTVGKPISWAVLVIEQVREHVFWGALIAALISMVFSVLISAWIIRPVERFTHYAREVARGNHRVRFPRLGEVTEMRVLGKAYEDMRVALEGKKYVESYVEQLTHELKSPVAAIKGASELLTEEMPTDDRIRFLSNIRSEAGRMERTINHLFKLSELESTREIQKEQVDIHHLMDVVLSDLRPQLQSKSIHVTRTHCPRSVVWGDQALITLAVMNLLQNAVDFSPLNASIRLGCLVEQPQGVVIVIEDEGPGIPNYAWGKITEKFFSLPRPDTGKKSSGLGLAFVQQIAELHGGSLLLVNREEGGVRARLMFPQVCSVADKPL